VVYQRTVRRALFSFGGGDAERAHENTIGMLSRLSKLPPALAALRRYFTVDAPRTVFGLRFPNPVGLAAGMDKDGRALPAWPALGFGFVEVGTVTRHAQPGNPKPRLYRLPDSRALLNRMGFNNAGAHALADRLAKIGPLGVPLGISLGKSKITPNEEAVADYRESLRALYPYGDYFAVNVSSPNTPGLRELQDRAALSRLLEALRQANTAAKPILVKIAPDLTEQAIGELLEVCADQGVAGLIATNTTLARDGLSGTDRGTGEQPGGLSGRPLHARAVDVVRFVRAHSDLPVIGVGGIMNPPDALRMLDAGASLVQVYTGLIYSGPGMVRGVNRMIAGR
jgi:dihydroorotate dehydrogenase